jgi:hypothetical protein
VYIKITTCGKSTHIGYQDKIKAVAKERWQPHREKKGTPKYLIHSINVISGKVMYTENWRIVKV